MKHGMICIALLLSLALACTLLACGAPAADTGIADSEEGALCADVDEEEDGTIVGFSDFTTKDVEGNTVDQTVFQNAKLTIFNMWGTFCSPCISEMSDFAELQARYADKGVQFVGLVGDVNDAETGLSEEQRADIRLIVEQTGANYLQLLPSADLNRLMLQHISAFPTTALIDANGNFVGELIVGTRPASAWTKLIDDYLASIA